MKNLLFAFAFPIFFGVFLSGCSPVAIVTAPTQTDTNVVEARTLTTATSVPTATVVVSVTSTPVPSAAFTETPAVPPATATASAILTQVAQIPVSSVGNIPVFDHIVVIVLENHSFDSVIGNSNMPVLNALASDNVLLTQYYAIRHPSLPNYIALISGDTFDIRSNCTDCFLSQTSLPDLIEASGRTWKTYQEDMPTPCFKGNDRPYMQKHNPFVYFDNIRLDGARCGRSVVPLTQLDYDLTGDRLPNFVFITPNLCNSSHDCDENVADTWLGDMLDKLQNSPALGENSLIVVTYDEAADENKESCCGLPKAAGGRIATVLISPLAKPAFEDSTPYSHYSLLKTVLLAWGLPALGNTAMPETLPILEPWK